MKIHLHLGAHKTATTHFQNVLFSNRHLFTNRGHYEPMEIFRKNVTQGSRFFENKHRKSIEEYINKLVQQKVDYLILSEENLIGDTTDIYSSNKLYCNMEKRLSKLVDYLPDKHCLTIWFSIRSMDEFIPSLYCESLIHTEFQNFRKVLKGKYYQSWMPIIKILIEKFPNSKINIIVYEKYNSILPIWLREMTGIKNGWNLFEEARPRKSMSHIAIKLMTYANGFMPKEKKQRFLNYLNNKFLNTGYGKKFSPFNMEIKSNLKNLYEKDMEEISMLKDNVFIFNMD